jgi:hypothetical protein
VNTIPEIKQGFLVRMGVSTTLAYYTDSILNQFAKDAVVWAAGYKKWPFTEGRISTTWASTEENSYPEGWRRDTIRYLQLGGKRVQKLDFESYQRFREENPDDNSRIFTDYDGLYFINPNIDVSGTTTLWGQYIPYVDEETTATPFSNVSEEGNEAILQRMIAYAKEKEKNSKEAIEYYQKAKEYLDIMYKQIQDEQFAYHSKDRGMFSDFDVLYGSSNYDENQF